MNIAYVIDAIEPYSNGGREKRLIELTTRLAKMGNEVHIYTMKWWDGPKNIVENGVNLHAICKYHPMYKGDTRSIKQGVLFGLSTLRMINKKFDVIDVDHMPYFSVFGVWLVCKMRRKRMFGTWHEALRKSDWIEYMGKMGLIASMIERVSIKLPDVITANSNHTKELIGSELKRTKNIYVVPNGINVDDIKTIVKAPNSCDVLYIGRLVKDKNVSMLVDAIKLITKNKPNVKCVLIGKGPEENNIKKQIKNLKLEKNIQLIEPLPKHRDILANMKSAKVFALPSNREGFGMVALEALACGTPVITLDVPANATKDLITTKNGELIQPDKTELAEAIEKWLNNKMDKSTIAKQVDEYDWNKLANKQEEVYKQ
jgi:glycosyltransferase involved in cell wall biosynthesis